MKATYVEKEVEFQLGTTPENLKWTTETQGYEIFKDPITDSGMKKSAKGLLKVVNENDELKLIDQTTWEEVNKEDNLLEVRYKDGNFIGKTTLSDIRKKIRNE